ncbi:MAG: hypothetical protein IT379_11100 [Deltaproteobacteria bacterium]|nr:hypothetical protein [Deltaproteobacteria bacterium]
MRSRVRRRRCALVSALAAASTALACVALAACTGTGGSAGTTARPERRPTARLAFFTDLHGYLEPCGCQSRPLGGIDRMAKVLADVRRDRVPTLLLAAGDTLFDTSHLEPANHQQEKWKAETLVRIFREMRMTAFTPGPGDLAFGAAELARLVGRDGAAVLAANVRAPALQRLSASTVVPAGDLRIAVVGVTELGELTGPAAEGVAQEDAVEAARREVARVREAGADIVVVLTHGARRLARTVASRIEGVDFVLQAGIYDPTPAVPESSEDGAVVIQAGRQGHGVQIVDVYLDRRAEGPGRASRAPRRWTAIGAAARAGRRATLDERIAELSRRITEWQADPNVSRADVAQQEARLADLRRERTELDAPERVPTTGNAFSARWRELDPDEPRLPAVRSLIASYDRRVGEHNLVALRDERAPPVPEGEQGYVGTERCGSCHTQALDVWRRTKHAQAWETLVDLGKHTNLSCVGCHLVGYRRPGGSTLVHHQNLEDVGCENCHGPGSRHAEDPTGVRMQREAPASLCVDCHNSEHSDQFDYRTYLPRILGPGHGRPMPDGEIVLGQILPDAGAAAAATTADTGSTRPPP